MALQLGEVFCSMEVLYAFAQNLVEEPDTFLARHANGDWGELSESDCRANEYALRHGLRVLSSYTLTSGERILVVTEGDRSKTTIMLSEEY